MSQCQIGKITGRPLPPVDHVHARSVRRMRIALGNAKREMERRGIDPEEQYSSVHSGTVADQLRLVENKLGLMEVVVSGAIDERSTFELVGRCLRLLENHGNGEQTRLAVLLLAAHELAETTRISTDAVPGG